METTTWLPTSTCRAASGVNLEKDSYEKVLAALADDTRRHLLNVLAALGQSTATILATHATISRQAVVKHLTVLERAGLVSSDRVGREKRYTVRTQRLESTAQWMSNLAADWEKKLESIKHKAEMNARAGLKKHFQ